MMQPIFFEAIAAKGEDLNQDPESHLLIVREIVSKLNACIYEGNELSETEIVNLVDRLTSYTIGVPVPVPLVPGITISRAVKYEEDDGKGLYGDPQRLSYIPRNSGIEPPCGRLNKRGEALFYGCMHNDANALGTILSEVEAEVGEIYNVLLSRTCIKERSIVQVLSLNVLPIGVFDYIRREARLPWGLSEDFIGIYEGLQDTLHPSAMLAMQLCDAFLTKVLKQENIKEDKSAIYPYLFEVTSCIGAEFLKAEVLDGILYPSTKLEGYPNLVLKIDSVDGKLKYEKAIAIKVEESFGYGIFKYTTVNQGLINKGKINWD
jgi:hypothetical protein